MDDFDFDLTTEFAGYNSSRDKTNISDRFLVRGSKNVYRKLSGTIAIRPGLLKRGVVDTTEAGVTSSYDWYSSLGKTLPIRVCNGKIQVEFNLIWNDIFTTSATRVIFDAWWDNTNKKDKLLFVLGDTNIYDWSGGITTFASGAATTITKEGTTSWAQEGFTTTGTITIGGIDYTYSGGSDTATLTGVSADTSAIAVGTVIIQKVVTVSNKPASTFTNDFIKVIGNRLHCGSYTSRLVYISKQSDYTDFTIGASRVPGDAELLTLDSNCKGIANRVGLAHIAGGTSDWYVVSYSQVTVGAVLTEVTKVDKQAMASLDAALGHEFIDIVGDTLVYLDQNHQLRTFGTFRNIFTPKFPTLSIAIYDELKEQDFTGGHVRAIGTIIYITAPLAGTDYMHETRESIDPAGNITAERFWHPPQVRNVSRFAVIDGVVYGHSNANPMIYQMWDTSQWHDDGPAGDELPYEARMRMAYKNANQIKKNRTFKVSSNKAFYEGYMTQGSTVGTNLYMDYQGSYNIQSPFINDPENGTNARFYTGTTSPGMGDSALGDNPLGDGLTEESNDQELLPKFRKITPLSPTDCFEYQMEVYSSGVNNRWEILCLGVNVMPSDLTPIELLRNN